MPITAVVVVAGSAVNDGSWRGLARHWFTAAPHQPCRRPEYSF